MLNSFIFFLNLMTEEKKDQEKKTEEKKEKQPKTEKKSWWFLVSLLVDVEKFGKKYFVEKAPLTLPEESTGFIANALRYIAFLIAILLFIGIFKFKVSSLLYIIAFFIVWNSVKPLGEKKISWWRSFFYAVLIMCLWGIVDWSFVLSVILGFLAVYILFQIRGEFK